MDYAKHTFPKLREICTEFKITGTTGKNKCELIEMIKQKDALPPVAID